MTVPDAEWDEILLEIEERYGSGVAGLRVEQDAVRFENRHDDSAFRLFCIGATVTGRSWRLEEPASGRVVRAGVGRTWRTALDDYDVGVRRGDTAAGSDPSPPRSA
jgi:hypothetical protein